MKQSNRQGRRPEQYDGLWAPPRKKKFTENKEAKRIRYVITALLSVICLLLFLLLILPLFHVTKVLVAGNEFTDAQAIVDASGVWRGEETFAVRSAIKKGDISANVLQNCVDIKGVEVRLKNLWTVEIKVEENGKSDILSVSYQGNYYMVDRAFNVLAVSPEEQAFSRYLSAKLPPIADASVGEQLSFTSANQDTDSIFETVDFLQEQGLLDCVTEADFSQKNALTLTLNGQVFVKLGSFDGMEQKLEVLKELQSHYADDATLEIDLTNPQKATVRNLSETNG